MHSVPVGFFISFRIPFTQAYLGGYSVRIPGKWCRYLTLAWKAPRTPVAGDYQWVFLVSDGGYVPLKRLNKDMVER